MKSKGTGKGNRDGDTPAPGERLFTVAQVAERWQVSQITVRRMIADGRLTVRRLGRTLRIPAEILDDES